MAKKMTLDEVGGMIEHVIKHMATKEDLKDEIDPIKATLAEHTEMLKDHTNRLSGLSL